MVEQGYAPGRCRTRMPDGSYVTACRGTLKKEWGSWYRVIKGAHLSRPEDYYSIYQSGCNHECLKCHSWNFSQVCNGFWASTDDLADMVAEYEQTVTVIEPRERATMWHATDLCRHCGNCKVHGVRGPLCPNKLNKDVVVWGPQGWGPARNIVSFTGGDVGCQPEFYAQATERIKEACTGKMWVLFETNGYGITPRNLDLLASSGLDSFWLDIKAYDEDTYRRLCGVSNEWILKTPEWIVNRGFTLEVASLLIPGWVEKNQIVKIAQLLYNLNPEIPFTVLAFFPAYKLEANRPPTMEEMINTFLAVREVGLKNVKLGNCNVFARSNEEWTCLSNAVGKEAIW